MVRDHRDDPAQRCRRGDDGIRNLRSLGVHLSVDDFGTGYSSLTYLKKFPVEAIKIDRSFVDGLGIDGDDSSIVDGVIRLGHSLGLQVIAEGVETPLQLEQVPRDGCRRRSGVSVRSAVSPVPPARRTADPQPAPESAGSQLPSLRARSTSVVGIGLRRPTPNSFTWSTRKLDRPSAVNRSPIVRAPVAVRAWPVTSVNGCGIEITNNIDGRRIRWTWRSSRPRSSMSTIECAATTTSHVADAMSPRSARSACDALHGHLGGVGTSPHARRFCGVGSTAMALAPAPRIRLALNHSDTPSSTARFAPLRSPHSRSSASPVIPDP